MGSSIRYFLILPLLVLLASVGLVLQGATPVGAWEIQARCEGQRVVGTIEIPHDSHEGLPYNVFVEWYGSDGHGHWVNGAGQDITGTGIQPFSIDVSATPTEAVLLKVRYKDRNNNVGTDAVVELSPCPKPTATATRTATATSTVPPTETPTSTATVTRTPVSPTRTSTATVTATKTVTATPTRIRGSSSPTRIPTVVVLTATSTRMPTGALVPPTSKTPAPIKLPETGTGRQESGQHLIWYIGAAGALLLVALGMIGYTLIVIKPSD